MAILRRKDPVVSLEKARTARDEFSDRFLSGQFNVKAAKPPLNSFGLSRDAGGYFVSVTAERKLTAGEKKKLPKKFDGVRVKYRVIGKIRPQI